MKIEIEATGSNEFMMTLDGIRFSSLALKSIIEPRPNVWYRFIRKDNEIICTQKLEPKELFRPFPAGEIL